MSWPSEELEDLFIFEDGMLLKWWSAFVKACHQRQTVLGITKTKFYCADGSEKDDAVEDDFVDMFAPDGAGQFAENVDRLLAAITSMCTSPWVSPFNRDPSGKVYLARRNPEYDEDARYYQQPPFSDQYSVPSYLPFIHATPPSIYTGYGIHPADLEFWEKVRDFFDEAKYVGLALMPTQLTHTWTTGVWLQKPNTVGGVGYSGGWLECESTALEPHTMSTNARLFGPAVWRARHRCRHVNELPDYQNQSRQNWTASFGLSVPKWHQYNAHWWSPRSGPQQYHPGGWVLWPHVDYFDDRFTPIPRMESYETESVRATYDTTPLDGKGEFVGAWAFVNLRGTTQRLDDQFELVSGEVGGDTTTLTWDDVAPTSGLFNGAIERMDISDAVDAGDATNHVDITLNVPSGSTPWTTEGVYNVVVSGSYPYTQTPESGQYPTGGSAAIDGRDIYVFCDPGDLIEN